MIIEQNFASRY